MKKIRYNIASEKKLNQRKIIFISTILVVLSLGCIAAGISRWSAENRQQRDEIEELNILKDKFKDVKEMIADYRDRTDKIKKKWGKKINFSNEMINRKSNSLIEKLNVLEDLIPDEVFVNNISMVNDSKSGIQIGFISRSFKNLMDLYNKLSKYDMVITKESVLKNKMCRADLVVKIKNEKN